MNDEHSPAKGRGDEHPAEIPITIDKRPYKAPKQAMTGAEIRQLANPAIGPDRDLWHVGRGEADDTKVADTQVVNLEPGDRFFSAPGAINPGASVAASR